MNRVAFGWYVWCVGEDYREPEGTVFLDYEPQIGGILKLSDNQEWKIKRINQEELELTVEKPQQIEKKKHEHR